MSGREKEGGGRAQQERVSRRAEKTGGGSRQTGSTALDGKDASWKAGGEPRHVIP